MRERYQVTGTDETIPSTVYSPNHYSFQEHDVSFLSINPSLRAHHPKWSKMVTNIAHPRIFDPVLWLLSLPDPFYLGRNVPKELADVCLFYDVRV